MKFPEKDRDVVDVIVKVDRTATGIVQSLQEAGLRKIVFRIIHSVVLGEIEAYKISSLKELNGVLEVNKKLDQYDPR